MSNAPALPGALGGGVPGFDQLPVGPVDDGTAERFDAFGVGLPLGTAYCEDGTAYFPEGDVAEAAVGSAAREVSAGTADDESGGDPTGQTWATHLAWESSEPVVAREVSLVRTFKEAVSPPALPHVTPDPSGRVRTDKIDSGFRQRLTAAGVQTRSGNNAVPNGIAPEILGRLSGELRGEGPVILGGVVGTAGASLIGTAVSEAGGLLGAAAGVGFGVGAVGAPAWSGYRIGETFRNTADQKYTDSDKRLSRAAHMIGGFALAVAAGFGEGFVGGLTVGIAPVGGVIGAVVGGVSYVMGYRTGGLVRTQTGRWAAYDAGTATTQSSNEKAIAAAIKTVLETQATHEPGTELNAERLQQNAEGVYPVALGTGIALGSGALAAGGLWAAGELTLAAAPAIAAVVGVVGAGIAVGRVFGRATEGWGDKWYARTGRFLVKAIGGVAVTAVGAGLGFVLGGGIPGAIVGGLVGAGSYVTGDRIAAAERRRSARRPAAVPASRTAEDVRAQTTELVEEGDD